MTEVFWHGSFYVVDGVVRVPTTPEGTIELRVVGDSVWIRRSRFVRGDLPNVPSETVLEWSGRVPVAALEELLKLNEGKG